MLTPSASRMQLQNATSFENIFDVHRQVNQSANNQQQAHPSPYQQSKDQQYSFQHKSNHSVNHVNPLQQSVNFKPIAAVG